MSSRPCAGGGPEHRFRLRVYFEDTDAQGVVYHANYLNFAERARTELLRSAGVEQDDLRQREGLGFAVRRCRIEFRAPARLDDLLEVRTVLQGISGARVQALQSVHAVEDGAAREEWLACLEVCLACVNRSGRAVRLPQRVINAFSTAAASRRRAGVES